MRLAWCVCATEYLYTSILDPSHVGISCDSDCDFIMFPEKKN